MLDQLFPTKLNKTVKSVFSTIPVSPVLLELIPEVDNNISGTSAESPSSFLCKNECKQLHKYTLAKRRSEYLTSRICAKMCVMDYWQSHGRDPITMEQIEILNSGQGYPFIEIHPAPSFPLPGISLSHSKEYVLAVAAQFRCGVDIQKHVPTLKKVKTRYCTAQEFSILTHTLKNETDLSKLALIWSAKEAIQKCFGDDIMPFFTEICLQKCENTDTKSNILTFSLLTERNQKWPEFLTVVTGTYKGYAIAITAHKEARQHPTREVLNARTPRS